MTLAVGSVAPRLAVPLRLDPRLLDGWERAAEVIDLGGATMGTTWRVRLALPAGRSVAPLQRAVEERLDGIVAQMSHWSPASLLSRYNRAPAGSWTRLPADFAAVVTVGMAVARRSGGAFDPALGRLTDLWGLGPDHPAAPPSPEALAAAKAASGWHRLAFDPAGPHVRQPGGLWLDLSGIAKGYAADAVADLLGGAGIAHALVEIGGECVGRGLRPDGEPWWVELETPATSSVTPLRVALHQLAVATSGDYLGGAHTLDPRTGLPVTHATTAVSVMHPSAMIADAWASALTVLAPAEARAMAEAEGLAVRILARDGGEWLSAALLEMLAE